VDVGGTASAAAPSRSRAVAIFGLSIKYTKEEPTLGPR